MKSIIIRNNTTTVLAIAAFWLLFATTGSVGSPSINVGTHYLQRNTAGQTIEISVSGSAEVQGLNLYAQIADGGPEAGGGIDGPVLERVDIITDTIFGSNNTGQVDSLSLPQISIQLTTTSGGSVIANGLLATLTIDTTGFSDGQFALKLSETLEGDSDFAGIPMVIENGQIVIVPEPTSVFLVSALVFVAVSARRHRRGRVSGKYLR